MTQPVTSARAEWLQGLDGPPPPPPPPSAPLTRDASALPDPGGGSQGQDLVRLAPLVATGVDAAQVPVSVVASRLDAALARATPTFRTDEGWVEVTIPFRMSTYPGISPDDDAVLARAASRAGVPPSQAALLHAGRATPEVIARVTQALIDGGHLPPRDGGRMTLSERVRWMMGWFGIGLDCAGYVVPATLAARGIGRADAAFRSAELEDLSNLVARGYAKVSAPDWVRPGDVFVLAPDGENRVGHRAIVREAEAASPSEIEYIKAGWPLDDGVRGSDRWLKIVVDSSWGSFGNPLEGGVARSTWWFDLKSGSWAWTERGANVVTRGPYNHTNWAIYAPRSSR